ncbi:MAG: DUF1007 family protein [Rhodospirillaceae bacterium]|nr:DUF1007 family protein [Rhodospirillaceae bacterium]MBT6084850.1 DUF1007 family protein [Rhodospirillaceae bacterium]
MTDREGPAMKRDHDTTAHRAKTIRRLTARSVIKFDRRAIMLTVACVLVHLLSLSPSARAHPHAWIDLRSTVHLNGDGQIVGIEQEWLFDNFYTVSIHAEQLRNLHFGQQQVPFGNPHSYSPQYFQAARQSSGREWWSVVSC